MSPQKQQVLALLKSIDTGDPAPAAILDPAQYIQHNLAVGDGVEGLRAVLAALPPGSARVNTVRVFEDGPFVFAHTEYDFFGPKIGFDVFRFAEGRIVEHWDNLQPTPPGPNPSGRSMTDGPTEVADLALTEDNRRLVSAFVQRILVEGALQDLSQFIEAGHYRQHNPAIADGLDGLAAAFAAMAAQGVELAYSRVHRVLAEGNFVLTLSEGRFAGQPSAFYDLFRVAGGRIVEHWDVIEAIPPQSEWKNANGKF